MEIESIVCTVIVLLVTLTLLIRWKRRRLYELASKIPGDDGIPLLGILHRFKNLDLKDYSKELLKYCRKDSVISKTWFGPTFTIVTEDAECIHTILNSPQTLKKPSYFYNGIYLDKGLLAINGQQYDKHRKILSKSFTPNMLHQFIPIFDKKSRVCVNKLIEKLDSDDFDVFEYIGACTLEAFISGHYNYDESFYDSSLVRVIEATRPLIMKRLFQPWYNIKLLYRLSPLYYQLDHYYKILINILNDIRSNNQKCPNTKLPDLVINLLSNPRFNFTEEEIRDEMLTFIFGGYETTAISLGSILLMLAMHKDVQQKVIDEIDAVVDSVDEIDNDVLSKFSYVELVIKETLRLFPAGGIIGRQSTNEIDLAGYTIPKGTIFVLSVYGMQRNAKYWGDDAHLFRPERFEPINIANINPHAFTPFSGGKRICIGWKYSMIFMKIFLIHFFKTYTVDTKLKYEKLTVDMTPTMMITQRYMISINKRGQK